MTSKVELDLFIALQDCLELLKSAEVQSVKVRGMSGVIRQAEKAIQQVSAKSESRMFGHDDVFVVNRDAN